MCFDVYVRALYKHTYTHPHNTYISLAIRIFIHLPGEERREGTEDRKKDKDHAERTAQGRDLEGN